MSGGVRAARLAGGRIKSRGLIPAGGSPRATGRRSPLISFMDGVTFIAGLTGILTVAGRARARR